MTEDPDEIPPDDSTPPPEAEEPAVPQEEAEAAETAEPAEVAEPVAVQPGESSEDALLQPCINCATLLDVGDLEPFAKVHCPICGTAMRARTQLKNFTLVEVLGAGGMGAVYKALDTNLNRMVALKVVRKEYSADAKYVAKFEREARITAAVNHPHVVKVYSFGSDHGLLYIAMELVDKGSLDDLMNLQGRVAEIQALSVGIQVAQGLQAAHQIGLIHRDVKPGNILFADAQTAKIVDFGLALLAEHEAEERGEVWGTPYYVAPEKLDHAPEDFRSDIYSLGGTLFHAIAGRPPFEADTASMVALKHLKSKAVSLQAFAPDVSSATAYVINRTLKKDPDQRYQSYAELIEHLEYAKTQLTDTASGPRKAKQRVVVEGAGQRTAAGIVTLVLIVLLLGIGAGIYEFKDRILAHANPAVAGTVAAPEAVTALHDQFDAARKQIVSGDYAGAQDTLKKLNDSDIITQPLQNWVTLSQGLVSLLQENVSDARDWFKVVRDRGHYSDDPSDATLVNFFTKVGNAIASGGAVSVAEANHYGLDSVEALAPFLFALNDWSFGKFGDSASMFALYLSSTPKDPFQWIADFKPIAQKYADDEAAYEKVVAAAGAAGSPDQRADALKQAQDLHARVKGRMASEIARIEAGLKKKSADLDPAYNQRVADEKQRDQTLLGDARIKYAAFCADFRFDEGYAAIAAAGVTGSDGVKEKAAMLKKAEWLKQFKTQLIQDINTYGYSSPVMNRAGSHLPDGARRASDASLFVQTQFGNIPFAWNSLPAAALLAMANEFTQSTASTAPRQASDRQWLAGVFACEEGMPRDGHTLLVQASQTKDEYKDQLSLFLASE
jgi:hypothetical protein